MKLCRVIRHVPHEGLGTFEAPLRRAGFEIRYHDAAGASQLTRADAADAMLLVVMGGPMGVYETDAYPFLASEIELIAERLDAGTPLLGVCLGSQLIAKAAGARVYPGEIIELGFDRVELTDAGRRSCLAPLAREPTVLHWHGDTYDLPAGATRLASSRAYAEQAYALGANVLAMQFHLEVDAWHVERWIEADADYIRKANADAATLRAELGRAGALAAKADEIVTAWLAGIENSASTSR